MASPPVAPVRLLFVARYRDATMDRKVELLAADARLTIRQIRPSVWRDEFFQVQQASSRGRVQQVSVPMLGRPNDPHRAIYRTLDFGMLRFRPHLIHAEEE